MTFLKNSILVLAMIILSSCGKEAVQFDPIVYVASPTGDYLINRYEHKIDFYTPEFRKLGCMPSEKWVELKGILDRAEVPKKGKNIKLFGTSLLGESIKFITK